LLDWKSWVEYIEIDIPKTHAYIQSKMLKMENIDKDIRKLVADRRTEETKVKIRELKRTAED
jgi:hypothetical protein